MKYLNEQWKANCQYKGRSQDFSRSNAISLGGKRWRLGSLGKVVVEVAFIFLTTGHLRADCFFPKVLTRIFVAVLVQAAACRRKENQILIIITSLSSS